MAAIAMTRSASSESTGGIGPSYERTVAAAYLAAMLAGAAGPGLGGKVTYVAAQQQAALDDLELRFESRSAGGTATMRLQLKHRLTLSDAKTNTDFADIVADSWKALQQDGFSDAVDRIAAAAENLSKDSYYASHRLAEMATLAKDGDGLVAMLDQPGQGGEAKAIWNAVATLSARALGTPATNDQLRRFWQHFRVLRIETTLEIFGDRIRAIDQLRSVVTAKDSPDPAALYGTLELIAGTLNVRGAGLDADQLMALLAERYAIHIEPQDPQLEPIARTAHTVALQDARSWRAHLGVKAIAPKLQALDPIASEGGDPANAVRGAVFDLSEIEKYLRRHRRLAILGAPGAGKSQSLVQIADQLLEVSELIPIVHSLPKLALAGGAILERIGQADPYRAIGHDGLALLARAGRLALLLDGWNELGPAERDWAWHSLDDLKRLYPAILLGITSRSGSVRPYGAELRLKLLAFDRDRQMEAAALQHGAEGQQLLIRARAKANLRPLLGIPLFLTAILAQAAAGRLPDDRESAIAQLIDVAKGTDKIRDEMRTALDGQQRAMLEDLAWEMMVRGNTAIGEADTVQVLADSFKRLRSDRKLFAAISPPQALDQLLADSILTAAGEPGMRSIGFSHQLLQEWFASHRIDPMIAAAGPGPLAASLLQLVDAPFWATAILFSVERLARGDGRKALGALASVTLGIEPFFAAEMLVRMPEAMKSSLDRMLGQFATEWSAEQPTRAFAFMLASGRPQFSETLWKALAEHGDMAFGLREVRQHFPLDALTPGWKTHFATLKDQTRRVLLIDIIDQGSPEGLDRVVKAALADPGPDVVSGVIDYLGFHDERSHLNALIAALDDSMGKQIAREGRPDGLDDKNRARWRTWRRSRLDQADGVEWVDLALEFDAASPATIVQTALAIKFENSWGEQGFYERIANRYGEALGDALAERLSRGERIPFGARPYLPHMRDDSTDFLVIAISEARLSERGDAARMLDSDTIVTILAELLSASSDPRFRRDERLRRLFDALEHVQFDRLADAVLRDDAADANRAAVLAALLAGWKSDDDSRPMLPLAPGTRIALEAKVRAWTKVMLADAEGPRFRLVELGRLIGRMGCPTLLPELLQLIEEDRTRQRRQQEEFVANGYRSPDSEARMFYDNQYQDALVRIDSAEVVDAMVERFPDPAWEKDAASVLGRLRVVDPKPNNSFGPRHDDLAQRRAALAERATRAPEPVAKMILDRIDQLVTLGDKDSITRAMQLSASALYMDYGDRVASLRAMLETGQDTYRFIDFCRAFAERGELLPAKTVHEQLSKESEAIAAMRWHADNDLWKVRAWLRLVAFADDPAAAFPAPDILPKDFSLQRGTHDLMFALGFSTAPTATQALEMLRRTDPLALFGDTWARALAELGTDQAANILLDAIETTPADPEAWRDTHGLRTALAAILTQPQPRARAFAMLESCSEPVKLGVLTHAIVETLDEADAVRLLELADRPERAVIGRELIDRLENAAVTRTPIAESANTYELEAAAIPTLRKRAFELMLDDVPQASWARKCLHAIDHLRDRYGKPSTEPNHPYLAAQVSWPSAGRLAWSPITIDWFN